MHRMEQVLSADISEQYSHALVSASAEHFRSCFTLSLIVRSSIISDADADVDTIEILYR